MTGLVRFMGWLAVAVGVIAAIVPLVNPSLLPVGDSIVIAFVGIFAGIGLVAVAKLLDVAEKIEANTNWFSVSAAGAARPPEAAAQAGAAVAASQAQPSEAPPEPEPQPEPARRLEEPEPVYQPVAPADEPASRVSQPEEAAAPPATPEAEPVPGEPEVYDANIHPPAIEEWAYGTRRVMTLRDGSVATELDGVWYRFVSVQDLAAYVEPEAQEAAGTS